MFPMIFFQSHVVLMAAGSVMIAAAIFIAMTQRRKRWWLRLHRGAGLSGAVLILGGAAAVVTAITIAAGKHFNSPHTWFGALTVVAVVVTPLLGFMQFKIRQRAESLRFFHRIGGRILAGALLITILLGLRAVGIL
jgi:hypothetical protein